MSEDNFTFAEPLADAEPQEATEAADEETASEDAVQADDEAEPSAE